jgi:hypothetical protein
MPTADIKVEPHEEFNLNLSDVVHGGRSVTASSTLGVGTVLNDDYLTGWVFDDLDNDGVFETADGDAGVEGVLMQLVNESSGLVVDSEFTGASGQFGFDVTVPGGMYKIVEVVDELADLGLLDGLETAGVNGGMVDNSQDRNEITGIDLTGDGSAYDDVVDYLFAEIRPSDLYGSVWRDFNDDGQINFQEPGIDRVAVRLEGTDDRGSVITKNAVTAGDGSYAFVNLRPGTYSITEQPQTDTPLDVFDDGLEALGQVTDLGLPTAIGDSGRIEGDDQFARLQLVPGCEGTWYNFGECPQAGAPIGDQMTATIGF